MCSKYYPTVGLIDFVLFSLSRDTPDAGSTCSASSMQPDDGLEETQALEIPISKIPKQFQIAYKMSISVFQGQISSRKGDSFPLPLATYSDIPSP